MARGRIVNKRISMQKVYGILDREVSPAAPIIMTWLQVHLDREGRYSGEPVLIKGTVVPWIDSATPDVIDRTLDAAHRLGLIQRYEVDGDQYLWWPQFEHEQHGLRKDREAPSEIPPPPEMPAKTGDTRTPDQLRSNSGVTPEQVGSDSGPTRELLHYKGKGKYKDHVCMNARSNAEQAPTEQPASDCNAGTSAERCSAPEPDPPVCSIVLRSGGVHLVTQSDASRLQSTYPSVDIRNELRRMADWCASNPRRRKTARGVRRFISGWCQRSQQDASHGPPRRVNGHRKPDIVDSYRNLMEWANAGD